MNAVVFDCDGVLVDSEPLSEAAWTEVLAPYGYTPGREDFDACLGKVSRDTYAHYAARADLPGPDVVIAAVDAVRWRGYEEGVTVFADALETVRVVAAAGVPMAVASSSSSRNLRRKLDVSGLGRYFDVVVAGDAVERGKPAPDLYLAAAAGLGVDPAGCLAVEDATVGAAAAAAAGMRVVLVDRGRVGSDARFALVSSLDGGLLLSWLR